MFGQSDLAQIVASDLMYLAREWNDQADDGALRRGSPVLRRLLVNGELQQAWKAFGRPKEPQISAWTLDVALKPEWFKWMRFATAGGAKYRGMEIMAPLQLSRGFSPEEMAEVYKAGPPVRTLGLREFTEAPCIIFNSQIISRRLVIKYVANKLGGTHHDVGRDATAEGKAFALLDQVSRAIKLNAKHAVYLELLAIGQTLVASEDIKRFCEDVRKAPSRANPREIRAALTRINRMLSLSGISLPADSAKAAEIRESADRERDHAMLILGGFPCEQAIELVNLLIGHGVNAPREHPKRWDELLDHFRRAVT